jgi:MFS family permease
LQDVLYGRQSVLSTFVYLLQDNDPKAVGFVSAAMGFTQLFVSFPAGYLSDRYRRDYLLKLASCVGLVAIGLTYVAILAEHSFIWLTVALSVWGLFWDLQTHPSVPSLPILSKTDNDRNTSLNDPFSLKWEPWQGQ